MIRIQSIHIEEFRGVRALDLDLAGGNFGICGPNGTGKSGVVDAIEFCLTGNVTRLSGQGAGELSVKGHAPHVDQRNSPNMAKVSITAVIPSLQGRQVTISRAVDNPRAVSVTPAGAEEKAVVAELQAHPEFALSRREIAKYIIAQPAKRSEYVQDLLRLDLIGKTRAGFQTYSNKTKREAEEAKRAQDRAENELKTALNVKTLDRGEVLERSNTQRRVLGLADLTELTPATSFTEGVEQSRNPQKKPALDKAVALADLSAVTLVTAEMPENLAARRENARGMLEALGADEKALMLARQHGLVTSGLDLVCENACPLCDQPWDAEELRSHLKEKLQNAAAIGARIKAIESDITALLAALEERTEAIGKLAAYAAATAPDLGTPEVEAYAGSLAGLRGAFSGFLHDHGRLGEALAASKEDWWPLPADVHARLDHVRQAVAALPDASAKDQATGFLAVLQDRYSRLIGTSKNSKERSKRYAIAQRVYEQYNEVSNAILEGIYDAVAVDFTRYYRAINDDEDVFAGKLKAGDAALSFKVDFYGRGNFPPGAYHSEGHQDSMGLCLYLALMNHTLGDKFTFAVLDDVLMSVDTGHRREVCRLLKAEFPNTQFILTTHDRIWLQYMKTEGLIKKGQFFSGWHVATGPRIWDDTDVWTEINAALNKDDVPVAAALLRRYLEYISSVLADNLRASVEYREDGNHDLNDLMPPVFARWTDRLKKGVRVATHWGQDARREELKAMLAEAEALIGDSKAEQKPINQCVHFNAWANYTRAEFQTIADAFRATLDHMRCSNLNCGGFPYLTPKKGPPELLRCSCQSININLKDK
jgi:ABC-type cobalamin/Fe3+-siderophores transport system ATPase subunit